MTGAWMQTSSKETGHDEVYERSATSNVEQQCVKGQLKQNVDSMPPC
jgi:hypothetical protein